MVTLVMLMMMMVLTNYDILLSGSSFRSSSLPDPFSREALQPAADYILVDIYLLMYIDIMVDGDCGDAELQKVTDFAGGGDGDGDGEKK